MFQESATDSPTGVLRLLSGRKTRCDCYHLGEVVVAEGWLWGVGCGPRSCICRGG
jgi:hypothetical protein